MKLSVNILTWNTMGTLKHTINILATELASIDSEIIIVDNGSKDGCQEIATIKNEVNLGISKGKNQGISRSQGDYILLLDGDIVPVPNSINCLLNYMENNPECDAIGFAPNKFSRDKYGDQETYCHNLNPVSLYHGHCIYYGMYRRKIFDKIRFDETFGPGYGWEDIDFQMQMERAGFNQWLAGINHVDGKYYHNVNSSLSNQCLGKDDHRLVEMQRSKIFMDKWDRSNVSKTVA